jgi:predicted Zn-dependent protease
MALSLKEKILTERGDTAGLAKLHADELHAPCLRPEDFVRRSQRLLALDQNDEARFAADQGLQIDQGNPELRFNTAMASLRLGEETRAARELGRVEGLSPDVFATAMQMRAALLLRLGDPAEALASLEQRLASLPNDVNAVLDSARTLVGGGARSEARTLLQTRVDADPMIALELATILLQDGDIEGAGRVATAALK